MAYAINQDLCEFDCEIDTPADDFADLDQLLAGAVKAAEIRKAAKALKKVKVGTITQEEIEALHHANDLLTWDDESSIARFIETHCACGSSHQRFDGWFIVSQHRRDASARRFRRSDSHEDLPAWRYVAVEQVSHCVECFGLMDLPLCTPEALPGVEALGACPECDCGQMVLELDEEEDAAIDEGDTELDLFDELDELEEIE